MKPVKLGPNQFPRFYRGGPAIAALRGSGPSGDHLPEDWVGSTTAAFGADAALGPSRLPDGRLLRDALAADPEGFLGPAHAAAFGPDPALLVKLLDAGQRLPVHCHPDRAFARRHLACPYGKTEAWVIAGVPGRNGVVHLGFRSAVPAVTVAGWVAAQDAGAMLAAMNALPVVPGDAVLVPAGVPHAVGEGVFLVELQEPTDFSVLLEWDGFALDGEADGHLGLGFDLALQCLDRSGWGRERLLELRGQRARGGSSRSDRLELARPGVEPLLPEAADPFFRAERVQPGFAAAEAALEPSFAILVVLGGQGRLDTGAGGPVDLARGDTVLVPFGAGPGLVTGRVDLIRCLPPLPGPAPRGGAGGVP
jgi:mannose-6-phosphate isomerase